MGVAESNGDVRILIGSSQFAVCAHAQYIFDLKQPRPTSDFQVVIHSQLPRFIHCVSIKSSPFLFLKNFPNCKQFKQYMAETQLRKFGTNW